MSQAPVQPKPSARRVSQRRTDTRQAIAVCVFLVVSVLLVFSRTFSQEILTYDDNFFVYNEPHVSGGLSWSGLVWAFTNGPVGEWYPLSMLSHMLDCQLYGLNPAGHHLTNLLLHAASAVALFLVLWRMTAGLWPSAMVAALFALHPLHVESVAWLAERRDVLSGLFFMLTLGAYHEYVRHPESLGRYLAVAGLFALGLLAKPMLVTLPPLLLLLDFWPLRRFGRISSDAAAPGERQKTTAPTSRPAPFPWRVVMDKLPLLALALAAAGVTMRTHHLGTTSLTFPERLANAAVSYVAYLGQFFVPVGLSAYYAHPEAGWPAWQVAACVIVLVAITTTAVIGRRSYPYFFVGWFWYVGMLVPVLGLTFVGSHARADRYTYLSQIGLSMALVWGAMRLGVSWPARRWVFGIGSALMLAALAACSWRQTGFWQDTKTVWGHALACNAKNPVAHRALGFLLAGKDDDAAAAHFRQTLEIGPSDRHIYDWARGEACNDLGDIEVRKKNVDGAIAHYRQALEWDSNAAGTRMNLASLLAKQGNFDEAMLHFQQSIELAPRTAGAAYANIAAMQLQQGKIDAAIETVRKALAIEPNSSLVHAHLATLLAQHDDVDEAIVHFRRAIEIDPEIGYPYRPLAELLRKEGKASEAAKVDERGLVVNRRFAETQNTRGTELARQGKLDEAIAQFETAVAVFPDYPQAHNNLADALVLQGNVDRAIAHYRRALAIDPSFAPAKQSLLQLLNR